MTTNNPYSFAMELTKYKRIDFFIYVCLRT